MMRIARTFTLLALCLPVIAAAADSVMAPHRTNAENYKDRALAFCISEAYKGSPAGEDANITMSVYLDWTYYDLKKGDAAVDQLVEKYLRRDYSNPFEGYVGAKFDLLKCLDMYHSKELNEQVRKYVPNPNWIGNTPPTAKQKQKQK
jgi:hypothetical protein